MHSLTKDLEQVAQRVSRDCMRFYGDFELKPPTHEDKGRENVVYIINIYGKVDVNKAEYVNML